MPGWLQALSKANPLSCQVDALRGLLAARPDGSLILVRNVMCGT